MNLLRLVGQIITMKYTSLIIIAIALLVLSNVAAVRAQTKKTVTVTTPPRVRVFDPALKGKPEAEIESLEHKLSDALLAGDTTLLEEMYSDDLLAAGLLGNKTQYIAYMKQAMKQETKTVTAFEKSEMRIRIHGNTAVVTGQLTMDSRTPNGAGTWVGQFMNVWSKGADGRWQCIATS